MHPPADRQRFDIWGVVVDVKHSNIIYVFFGVPQGTVLGPLLFLLHIDDLPSVVSSKVRLFADDCLIYRNIKNKQDQITLQKDLNLLENWGNTWSMCFNASKCNIMQVSQTRDHKLFNSLIGQVLEEVMVVAPNDTAYTRWSCHSGLANTVQIVSTPPVPSNGRPITLFGQDGHADPLDCKEVWICDICHRQIQVRQQILIRCNTGCT